MDGGSVASNVAESVADKLKDMREKSAAAEERAHEDYRAIVAGGVDAVKTYPDRLRRAHAVAMEMGDYKTVQAIGQELAGYEIARRAAMG